MLASKKAGTGSDSGSGRGTAPPAGVLVDNRETAVASVGVILYTQNWLLQSAAGIV